MLGLSIKDIFHLQSLMLYLCPTFLFCIYIQAGKCFSSSVSLSYHRASWQRGGRAWHPSCPGSISKCPVELVGRHPHNQVTCPSHHQAAEFMLKCSLGVTKVQNSRFPSEGVRFHPSWLVQARIRNMFA